MGKGNIKSLVGIGLIGISFIPGIGLLGAALTPILKGFLFLAGTRILGQQMTVQSLSDRQSGLLSNPLSPQAQLPVIYGEARIAFVYSDIRNHPTDLNTLYVVGAFSVASQAGGGIDNITKIYFDDRLAIDAPNTTGTLVTTGTQAPWNVSSFLQYAIHLGTNAQATNAELSAQFSAGAWPATADGVGIAYIVLKLKFDQTVYSGGVPNVSALMRGQKVFDPRSSTTVWSDNPALCIRDYLTSNKYGCAVPTSELDDQSFIDAANYCDELVNTGAVNQKRFTCNGALDTSQSKLDNLNELLSSCRGELVYQSGKFRLVIRAPATATIFELTEDNIVGDWEFSRAGSGVPNSITARFVDPSWNYQVREVTWPEAGAANGFLTADNGHLSPMQIDLPFVTDYYRAQQIAMTTLRESREDITVVVTAKQEALKLQVGDVVPLTHSTPAFTDKLFRVAAVAILPDALVRLVLREYDATAYTLDTQTTDPTPSGSGLPNPFTVAAPTSLVLTSDSTTALNTQGGEVVPRIKVDWVASTHPFVQRYDVEFKRSADAVWTTVASTLPDETETYIWPVTEGVAYDVRVRAVNTIGVSSAWLSGSVTPATKPGTAQIASVTIAWHESTDVLRIIVRGGVYVQSCLLEIDDDPNFASIFQTSTWQAITEDGQVNFLSNALAASDRNKPWYVRATPNTGAGGAGTNGVAKVAGTRVEGNFSKTLRIPYGQALPYRQTTPFNLNNGYLDPDSTGTEQWYFISAYLPKGVTITSIDANGFKVAAGDIVELNVWRVSANGVQTFLGTGTLSSTGAWTTIGFTLTELVGDPFYLARIGLKSSSAVTDSRFLWLEYTYTTPTLEQAI